MISRIRFRWIALILGCFPLAAFLAMSQEQPPAPKAPPPPQMQGQQPLPPQRRGPGFGPMQPGPMIPPGLVQRFQMRAQRLAQMTRRFQRRSPGPGMENRAMVGGMPGSLMGPLSRPEVQKELGITADQRKKLDDIRFASERSSIQARANVQVQQLELRRLMGADTPDSAAIDKKIQDLAQAQAALMRAQLDSQIETRNVLTKEQRDKIQDVIQRMRPAQPKQNPSVPPNPPAPQKP